MSWTRSPVRSAAARPPKCPPATTDVLRVGGEQEVSEGSTRQTAERLMELLGEALEIAGSGGARGRTSMPPGLVGDQFLVRPTMLRLVPVVVQAVRRELRRDSPVSRHAVRLAAVATLGYVNAARLARAARLQMRRLAVETGLAKYTEVRAVLDALEQGEAVPLPDRSGPLVLRLRTVLVQSNAHRDDLRRWAAEKMVHAVWGSPHRAVYEIATPRRRLSVDWRAELLADLC